MWSGAPDSSASKRVAIAVLGETLARGGGDGGSGDVGAGVGASGGSAGGGAGGGEDAGDRRPRLRVTTCHAFDGGGRVGGGGGADTAGGVGAER